LFVDAPIVWESKKWGVSRPGWGKLLEHFVERHSLLNADLVCCISQAVAEKVRNLGVSANRILVTPNATDLSHFRPQLDGQSIKHRYDLDDTFVIGWVGSFRKFHGLEIVLSAVSELQAHFKDIALLMIGDGFERDRIAKMAQQLGLNRVVFTGTIGYRELPQYINAMDLAVLSDSGTASYHYSPLKLQEYLACGRAVVAPRVGQISDYLHHGVDSLLVETGSSAAMVNAIELLYKNSDMRQRIARNARLSALKHGGWSQIVSEVGDRLKRIHSKYSNTRREN
jgi:glycosyltransferase involved in cell wall biosynthesis